MCFSAQADLATGLVVGAIGVDVLRHTRRPAERVLAAIPIVLAGHSLMEAFVWLGLQHHVSPGVWRPALWLYLAVAFGVLPVLVPVAIGALEPESNRRRMAWFIAIGVGVAVLLTYPIVRGPIEATIQGHHIDYRVDLWHGGTLVFFYVVATCGSLLASQRQHVRLFGAANLVVACALVWLNKSGFISLWCFWAAITSASIAVHLRAAHPPPRTPAAVDA